MATSSSATLTFHEILYRHKLKEEHFMKECPKEVQLDIAKKLKDWKMVGCYLNLSERDLTAINRKNLTKAQRKAAMFNTWHKREGNNATYLRLANALYKHGRKDLVELLCQDIVKITATFAGSTMPESKSEAMFRSNLEDIKSRFAYLLTSVRLALEKNHVTPIDVHCVLIEMFGCGDCLPKTNLEEIFTAVTTQRLWDYTHHSPVEKLLRRFRLSDYLSLMDEYKYHLSGFCTTTKLIDYISFTNIDGTDSELDLKTLTAANYQTLTVKLELGDRRIDTLSLDYVQDLWEEFAKEFNIPYLTAVIGKILSSSLHITWLITPDTADKIAKAAHESTFFQKHPNIIYVAINDIVYYEVVGCMEDLTSRLKRGICQYCEKQNINAAAITDQDVKKRVHQHVDLDHVERNSVTQKPSYVISVKSDATLHYAIRLNKEAIRQAKVVKFDRIIFVVFFYGFIAGLMAILFTPEGFTIIRAGASKI